MKVQESIYAKKRRQALRWFRSRGLRVLCTAAALSVFCTTAVPAEVIATFSDLPASVSSAKYGPGEAATWSGATASTAMRRAGIVPLGAGSSNMPDYIEDVGYMSKYIRNLKLTIEKTASDHFIFRITGRVKAPYQETAGMFHHYWGPFIAFTAYGNRAAPGLIPENTNTKVEKYHIIPDLYHEESVVGYKQRKFINQTDILTAQDTTILARGKTIDMYLSQSHTAGDKCKYPKTSVAKVVSYSNNTPAEEKNGSIDFDLDMRIELSDLHEAITGVYVGAYEYGYYSGSGTDRNAHYRVSSELIDGSTAFISAKKGKVRLSFRAGAGSGGPGSVELLPGSTYAPSAPTPPYGSRFLYWNGWNGTVPQSDTAYDAVYEEHLYHLSFDCAGGSAAAAMRDIRYADRSRAFPTVTKKGYELKAWKYTGN